MSKRSPINRMIDKACGFDPNNPPPGMWPILRCPACNKEQRAKPGELDPPDAALVMCPCPDCVDEDCEPRFYDRDGTRLPYNNPTPTENE